MQAEYIPGKTPATIPVFKLFKIKNDYYYGTSCCVPPEHHGITVSPKQIPDDKLTCDNNDPRRPPQGPRCLARIDVETAHQTNSQLQCIVGYGDIGNGEKTNHQIEDINSACVQILDTKTVTFNSILTAPTNPETENAPDRNCDPGQSTESKLVKKPTETDNGDGDDNSKTGVEPSPLQTHLDNRVFRMTKLSVQYPVLSSQSHQSEPPPKETPEVLAQNGSCGDTHTDTHRTDEQSQSKEYVFWFAYCIQPDTKNEPETISVSGSSSLAWTTNSDASNIMVKSGRLLILRVESGNLAGDTIFVVNDVS